VRAVTHVTPAYRGDGTILLRRNGEELEIRRPDGAPLRQGDLKPGQPVRIDEGGRLVALGNRKQRRKQIATRRHSG
jgi:hypothetical protein